MKNILILLFTITLLSCSLKKKNDLDLKNGDIVFQTSMSEQSQAIQLATKSQYSHCGIVFKDGKNYYVFEAIQPVQKTPLDKWINRGKGGHYVAKRLKNETALTPVNLLKMMEEGKKMNDKDYDLYFEWSNDRIYCSELIWKLYKEAGIELSKPEELGDFDLSHPAVQQKLKERYGNNIPMHEKVVSPAALFNSELLAIVE